MHEPKRDIQVPATDLTKKRLLTAGLFLVTPMLASQPIACAKPISNARADKAAQQSSINAPLKECDGWTIKQSSELYGEQLLVFGALGVKTSNCRSSITVVMVPPYDTVTVYNTANKCYFQGPVKTFRSPLQRTFALFNSLTMCDAPMEKIGTTRFNGTDAVKYRSTKAYTDTQKRLRKADQIPASNPSVIDSLSSNSFNLPAGAAAGLCKFYAIPLVPGVPMQVIAKDMDGDPHNYLNSGRATKTKVTASDFAVPPGYKKLKDVEEINNGNLTREQFELFGK